MLARKFRSWSRAARTCATDMDGVFLSCWGSASSGQLGLGAGNTANMFTPTPVPAITAHVRALSLNGAHTCVALEPTGAVRCFGLNSGGQLGVGTPGTNQYEPTSVPGVENVQLLSLAEYRTIALLVDGTLMAWGTNRWFVSATGVGTNWINTPQHVPSSGNSIDAIANIVAVESGTLDHHCAVTGDGKMYCFGTNSNGQLGGPTRGGWPEDVGIVEVFPGVITSPKAFAMGNRHTCAILQNGDVYCWGSNIHGQLGRAATSTSTKDHCPTAPCSPWKVTGVALATDIASGHFFCCAVLASGEVSCWGDNFYGQLGVPGDQGHTNSNPQIVQGVANAKEIHAGGYSIVVVHNDNSVTSWGLAYTGQLGIDPAGYDTCAPHPTYPTNTCCRPTKQPTIYIGLPLPMCTCCEAKLKRFGFGTDRDCEVR